MQDGERQKINVRQLPRTEQLPVVHNRIVEQTDVVSDKLVIWRGNSRLQTCYGLGNIQCVRIPWLGNDAIAAVLSQGARYPSQIDVVPEPL